MKKNYTLSIILIPALLVLFAFIQGPDAGYTGSPLDGIDCTDCHPPGPATQVSGWITSDIPPGGYIPGATYIITISTNDATTSRMGFQMTCETPAAKAGDFDNYDASRTQLKGSHVVTHTAAGTDPVGTPNTWQMYWTAPMAGTGQVTFYAAVNASDASGTRFDDIIYVTSLTVNESNVGITENIEDLAGHIYPNPASEYINIKLPLHAAVKVIDNIGREIMSFTTSAETTKLDISSLEQGIYYMQIQSDGQVVARSFLKR